MVTPDQSLKKIVRPDSLILVIVLCAFCIALIGDWIEEFLRKIFGTLQSYRSLLRGYRMQLALSEYCVR